MGCGRRNWQCGYGSSKLPTHIDALVVMNRSCKLNIPMAQTSTAFDRIDCVKDRAIHVKDLARNRNSKVRVL